MLNADSITAVESGMALIDEDNPATSLAGSGYLVSRSRTGITNITVDHNESPQAILKPNAIRIQQVIHNYYTKGTRLMTRGGETLIQQQRERQGTPINTTHPTTEYYNINRDILAQDTTCTARRTANTRF